MRTPRTVSLRAGRVTGPPRQRPVAVGHTALYVKRASIACAAEQQDGQGVQAPAGDAAADEASAAGDAAGAPAAEGNAASDVAPQNGSNGGEAPTILKWSEPNAGRKQLTRFNLVFALPWRRFKKGSYLSIKLEGEISEKLQSRFSSGTSMPAICEALRKAAFDPRVAGLALDIDPLAVGWGKVTEIRDYIAFFRKSGKPTVAYMRRGGEKEFFLACACAEIYVPPTGMLTLRGLAVTGVFLRGALDNVGVEPQVRRIGKYKAAGDQLLRRDMSDPNREQLSALLDDIYSYFVQTVAKDRNKTEEEVVAMLDEGIYDMQRLKDEGWITDTKYSSEVAKDLQQRAGGDEDKDLPFVRLKKYSSVSPRAFGLFGRKTIAIVREAGSITGGNMPMDGQITAAPLIAKLRALKKDKKVAAVVLRVDSPGGDALASDLMWNEIRELAREKPVVATMGDVAASGGYYMSMAAPTVVAHPLTVTGSIGVVTGKINAAELYDKLGVKKEVLSKGKFAELLQDARSFTEEEELYFDRYAEFAYQQFRDRAAESRGMAPEVMQEHAQGRVWSGRRALGNKLVDYSGGIHTAIALAKQAAEIPATEEVTLREASKGSPSLQTLISQGVTTSPGGLLKLLLSDPAVLTNLLSWALIPPLLQVLLTSLGSSNSVSAFAEHTADSTAMLRSYIQQLAGGDAGLVSGVLHSSASSGSDCLAPQARMPDIKLCASNELGVGTDQLLP